MFTLKEFCCNGKYAVASVITPAGTIIIESGLAEVVREILKAYNIEV